MVQQKDTKTTGKNLGRSNFKYTFPVNENEIVIIKRLYFAGIKAQLPKSKACAVTVVRFL